VLFVYYGTRGLAGAYVDGFATALQGRRDIEAEFAVSVAYVFPTRGACFWRVFFPLTDDPRLPRWLRNGPLRLPLRYLELCLAYAWLAIACLVRRVDTVNVSLIDDYLVTWIFARVVKALGCRVHVTAHDSVSYATAADGWRRRMFHLAARVVVHYDHVRRDLVREFGLPADAILVLPFPWSDCSGVIDPGRLARAREQVSLAVSATARVALFAGVVRPQKGVEVLLRGWRLFEGRRARVPEADGRRHTVLVVAGRGPALAADLAGLSALRVPVYLSDEHYLAWLERASLVVFPFTAPYYAHSSSVLVAALAARAVVVTDIPLFRALAGPLHAWVARANDPGSLADVLEQAFADDAGLTGRGAAARRSVSAMLDDLRGTLGAGYVTELLAQ
jgi:glycosyltransferase involved in cell wall biosynthesis